MKPERPEPLRVLLWCWGRRGGGPLYHQQLAQALARRSDLAVFLSLSRQSESFEATRALGLPAFEVDTYAGVVDALWQTLWWPRRARQFRDFLEASRIEVVLCTMCHPWSGWMAPRLRAPGRAYVITVHDATAHPGDLLSGWQWLLRANLRAADGVLCLSEHVRAQFLARFDYPAERTWVAPHGPLAFPSGPDRQASAGRLRRLLFFGRILPYKGLEVLIEAFEDLAERQDLFLHIAGKGSLEPSLARRIAAHPRIRLDNRWIPEQEAGALFEAADLVVVPYLEASQSGVVAAAYGMGRPVVVTPVGGLIEQVESGRTGLIAAETTPRALAAVIASLCEDESLLARCREGARQAGGLEPAWDEIARTLSARLWQIAPRDCKRS